MGPPGAEQHLGGAGRPYLAVAWPLLRCGVLLSLLELISLRISEILFDDLILLDGFLK